MKNCFRVGVRRILKVLETFHIQFRFVCNAFHETYEPLHLGQKYPQNNFRQPHFYLAHGPCFMGSAVGVRALNLLQRIVWVPFGIGVKGTIYLDLAGFKLEQSAS